MVTQVIYLGGDAFCTVFSVNQTVITVHDKETGTPQHIRAWLEQHDYPRTGSVLSERTRGDLPVGFYIRPYANDRYFRVHPLENQVIEEVPAENFGDVISGPDPL